MINKMQEIIQKFLKTKKPSEKLIKYIQNTIKNCNNAYYEGEGESPLLDEEYDKLVAHYKKFAPEAPAVDTKSKKRNKNLIDTQHYFPELVGTLDKTNYIYIKDKLNDKNEDANTVEEWLASIKEVLNNYDAVEVYTSWKLDGNSITITYNDKGEVVSALTRGKNGLGSDKTEYFKNRPLPKWFPYKKGSKIGIKYEAITTFTNKTKIEEILDKTYASPCSLVSGLLGGKNVPQEAIDLITLAPIRIAIEGFPINRTLELEMLAKLHEKAVDDYPIVIEFDKNGELNTKPVRVEVDNLLSYLNTIYQLYIENRETLDYPVDGIVIELVNSKIREILGRGEDRNNYEFALKFPYDTKRATVEDIEFYVSENGTGRITPVVKFSPIQFSRAVCDHVSIANYKRFKELKLAKGDSVTISYRNDVLAYLNYPEGQEHVGPPIRFIGTCPACGERLKLNETKTFVNCINKKCPSRLVGKYNNFLIKLGIDGIRTNTLIDLYNEGLLKGYYSLYKMTIEDIMGIDGYLETSATNIVDAIHEKKDYYDYEILGALGFKNISSSTSKNICKKYTMDEMVTILEDEYDDLAIHLVEIDGIADKTAQQFKADFSKSLKSIANLKKYIDIKDYKTSFKVAVNPKNIVLTGFRDPVLQQQLELAGHSIKSGVSKKTDILVTAEKGSGSVKEKKALELNIPVYSRTEFTENILPNLLGK